MRLLLDTIALAVVAGVVLLGLVAGVAQAAERGDELVRRDLESYLRARIDSPDAEIELPPLERFAVEAANVDGALRTQLSTREERPFSGRVAITVELFAGEQLLRRGVISAVVRVEEDVFVAARDLRRGDVLAEQDLRRVRRDASRIPSDAIRDPSQAVGLRATRSLRADRVLRRSQVENVPVVGRGDRVTLVLESGSIQIRAVGRAVEAGAVGDWIRVTNLDSKRELSGRVDREGRVHVAF